ncbi:hemoglobin subunit alpha-D-like isoform X1 [Poecilia latipinna]|uniref:hemoglobin subunit alpha-D-like isoform X1 n=1 Tax=Poecilia latipinna TaxID=48699 RepID=UPI00072DA962|nr:PREDICTED: hemoglobin subunit alpha-D-like isoform X1 [Poecilia latipinna]
MLSKKEKKLIKEIWERLTPVAADIGSDALLRMFASYPGTKTYFSHLDISPGSAHLCSHGKKIVLAIAEGAKDISQLTVTLAPLQTLHAYQLRIDPTNFKVRLGSVVRVRGQSCSLTVCSSRWPATWGQSSRRSLTLRWISSCQPLQPFSLRNTDETQPPFWIIFTCK